MGFFKVVLFLAAAAGLAGCAGAVTLKAATGVSCYYGEVSFLSPDGRLPYNNTESAVKREILDGGARIVETVTRPGPSHSMMPEVVVTELRRRKKTLVYDVSDEKKTLSGTVTFKDRALKSWTYDIKLKDGAAIKGSGAVTAEGLVTEKQLSGVASPMMIRENLKPVSEMSYRVRVKGFYPPGGAE